MKRRDYTFIMGMWWRLSHFLNSIYFVSNLEVLELNNLLEGIYNNFPDKYKPLVIDAFVYAKQIVKDRIDNSIDGIYAAPRKHR